MSSVANIVVFPSLICGPEELADKGDCAPPDHRSHCLDDLGAARLRGPDAVARFVCSLPTHWDERVSCLPLSGAERAAVADRRERMKKRGLSEETTALVLGVTKREITLLARDGYLEMLGTIPPSGVFWWSHKAKWPRCFDKHQVWSLTRNDVAAWRRASRLRSKFRAEGLKLAALDGIRVSGRPMRREDGSGSAV